MLLVRRRIELAKPAAEPYEIVIFNLLPAEQQGRPTVPDFGNVSEFCITQASQIHA